MTDPSITISSHTIELEKIFYDVKRRFGANMLRDVDWQTWVERDIQSMVFALRKGVWAHKDLQEEVEVKFSDKITPASQEIQITDERKKTRGLTFSVAILVFLAALGSNWLFALLGLGLGALLLWSPKKAQTIEFDPQIVKGTTRVQITRKQAFPDCEIEYPPHLGKRVEIWAAEPLGTRLET